MYNEIIDDETDLEKMFTRSSEKYNYKYAIHPDIGLVSILSKDYGTNSKGEIISKVKSKNDFYPAKVKYKDLKLVTHKSHPEYFL